MNEELQSVVEDTCPEIDIENQALYQKFNTYGYNVAIFYTQKSSTMDRYITITMTNESTCATEILDPIMMVDVDETDKEPDDIVGDWEIDVEDVNNALRAVDEYLSQYRQLRARICNLATIAISA